MPKSPHVREILIALAALSIGWWAHSSRPVQAQAAGPASLSYEFNNIGPGTSLSLYNPADNTIYHEAGHPSQVILPVIPGSAPGR